MSPFGSPLSSGLLARWFSPLVSVGGCGRGFLPWAKFGGPCVVCVRPSPVRVLRARCYSCFNLHLPFVVSLSLSFPRSLPLRVSCISFVVLGFPWLFSSSLSRSARLVRLRSPPPAFLTSPPDSLRFCRPLRRPFFVLLRASAAAGVLDGVIRILGRWSFASFQYSRSHRVCMRCALRRGS